MSINRTNNEDGFIPVNEALLNVITPMGLEFRRNSLVIGENTRFTELSVIRKRLITAGYQKSQIFRRLLLQWILSPLITVL